MNNFSKNLEILIAENQIKQSKVQKELNLSKNQIHYWIKGKAEPSIDDLITLADYFDISLDELVGRDFEYKPETKKK